MAKKTVKFPGGRVVTFGGKKRKGRRKTSSWNKVVAREVPKLVAKGMSPNAAMKKLAKTCR